MIKKIAALGTAVFLSDEALKENHAVGKYNKEHNGTIANNTYSANAKRLKSESIARS